MRRGSIAIVITSLLVAGSSLAEPIPFDSERWDTSRARVTEFEGRQALMGLAFLKDVEFQDGVIEVDMFVTGARSYPGVNFRIQSPQDFERFYVRPHRPDYYGDTLQYTPTFNGIGGWQLYHGAGCTSGIELPENRWFPLRFEVLGTRARVFVDGAETPALVIERLEHGVSKGTIGLQGPPDGTGYFSNFSYESTTELDFGPALPEDAPPGMITEWELSQPLKLSQVRMDRALGDQELPELQWQPVQSKASGLLDVARFHGRSPGGPDCILARTTLHADTAGAKELQLGYSDVVSVFLNGDLLFTGASAYRQRDPSFLGLVGLNDAVYLPLKQGDNELVLMLAETFGGWGFMARHGDALFLGDGVSEAWNTGQEFRMPESAAYDAARGVVYISNFDGYSPPGQQSVTKVALDGSIQEPQWVTGLANPTGLTIHGDRLFVVERRGVAEIDLDSKEIVKRHEIAQPGFLNDVAVDAAGRIYVSDSGGNAIYRVTGDAVESWLSGPEIVQPNGLFVHGNALIVGNNGDNCLKRVDLDSGEVRVVARMPRGIIDGIQLDERGNYLVSLAEGMVFRVTPAGQVAKLLDVTVRGEYTADFTYVADKHLAVVPALQGNRVRAYELVQ